MPELFLKDPQAKLDFGFNWSKWLATGETILNHAITVDEGITVDSSTEADGMVTVWLSGGTSGQFYRCACKITTNAGRTDERTMMIQVDDR